MKRTSVLRNEYDERVFNTIRSRSRLKLDDQKRDLMGGYIREARRIGWTWDLIAFSAQIAPATAKRWAEFHRRQEVRQ